MVDTLVERQATPRSAPMPMQTHASLAAHVPDCILCAALFHAMHGMPNSNSCAWFLVHRSIFLQEYARARPSSAGARAPRSLPPRMAGGRGAAEEVEGELQGPDQDWVPEAWGEGPCMVRTAAQHVACMGMCWVHACSCEQALELGRLTQEWGTCLLFGCSALGAAVTASLHDPFRPG